MLDRTSKLLLLLIAIGLWLNAVAPLFHPKSVRAVESFKCSGSLTVNPYGTSAPSIGGYSADFRCQ